MIRTIQQKLHRDKALSTVDLNKYGLDKLKDDYAGDEIYQVNLNGMSLQTTTSLVNLVEKMSLKEFERGLDEITVLDWGCGKGVVSYTLKQAGFNVVSCEVENYPHTKIARKEGIKIDNLTDTIKTPYKDKSFDIVIGFGVLEHVPYDQSSLIELNRVLKDDGMLFIFHLPSSLGWLHRVSHLRGIKYHDRLYSKRELKGLLKRAGFKTSSVWRRQLVPKATPNYKYPRVVEVLDQVLSKYTPFNLISSNVECVAVKHRSTTQGS